MPVIATRKEKTLNQLLKQQEDMLMMINQIKAQMKLLGSLQRFEELAKKGRQFARLKGVKRPDVLQYD